MELTNRNWNKSVYQKMKINDLGNKQTKYFFCPFQARTEKQKVPKRVLFSKEAEEQLVDYGKFERNRKENETRFEGSLDLYHFIQEGKFTLNEQLIIRKHTEILLDFFGCPFYTVVDLKRKGEQVEVEVKVFVDFVSGPSYAHKERQEKMNWIFKEVQDTDLAPLAKEYELKTLFVPMEEQGDLEDLYTKVGENPELKKWQDFWEDIIEQQMLEVLQTEKTKIKKEFEKRFIYSDY